MRDSYPVDDDVQLILVQPGHLYGQYVPSGQYEPWGTDDVSASLHKHANRSGLVMIPSAGLQIAASAIHVVSFFMIFHFLLLFFC